MKINVDELVSLLEVDDLTSFSVVSALIEGDIDRLLRAEELGVARDGYAWIDAAQLAESASQIARSPDWSVRYRGMIDYALTKGWWDAETSAIRAHITPPGRPHRE